MRNEIAQQANNDRVDEWARGTIDIIEVEPARNHTETVRQIIDAEISKSGRVSKYWVIEMIKVYITPTEQFNAWLDAGNESTGDGIKNMDGGTKVIFDSAMDRLPHYHINADGWIVHDFEAKALKVKENRFRREATKKGYKAGKDRISGWWLQARPGHGLRRGPNGLTLDQAIEWLETKALGDTNNE